MVGGRGGGAEEAHEGEGMRGRARRTGRAERLPRRRLTDRGAFENVLAVGMSVWHMGEALERVGEWRGHVGG